MNRLVGTRTLTRFALRRDRILLPVWVAVFTLFTVSSTSATVALYPDVASRTQAAVAVNEVPVAVALYGRIWDPTSLGALSLIKLGSIGAVLIGVLAIMLVTRHARAEEEKGRTELIGATVVGSWAGLAAAMLVTTVAMVAIGALSALGLTAVGLPAAGSWAFGLSWATTGMAFAGIAAVANQLSASARTANGIALVVLAATFLLRALGDVLGDASNPGLLTWLSPIGWGQQVRPFAGDRFWVLLLPVVFTVMSLAAAVALSSRRDLGAGLLPQRQGRAAARASLRSPLALAWRLQKGLLVGWLVAYAVFGAIIGSIINDLGDMMDTPQAQEMIIALGGSDVLLDAFIGLEFSILAFVTAAYGIVAVHRLAVEEADGHTEAVLATSVSRLSMLSSHVVVAVVGTTMLTLVQGGAFALASAAQTGDTSRIGVTIGAALAYLPAIWLMAALVVLVYGVVPRLTIVVWALLVGFVLVSELGALLEWPAWVMDASPFSHIAMVPAEAMAWTPVLVLLGLAGAVAAVGAAAFRRRDLSTP